MKSLSLILLIGLLLGTAFGTEPIETESGRLLRIYVRGFGGDFTLTDHHGKPFSLQSARGKVALLYFGYTSCADVCPTTLVDVAAAMRKLGPEAAARVQPLMITVDPKRDTLERLRAYLPYFHPSMLGLSGSTQEIDQVAKQYRAPRYVRAPDPHGFYVVDHSSNLFVIDTEGTLAYLISYGTPSDEIVKVVMELLDGADAKAQARPTISLQRKEADMLR